ncbi:MAG: MFS transporter [Actinomycetia bacterium]|nr:MFS transporter [Actinomycetes bacterium]MCP4960009.1 MFS transporter [Actinomycetes bacterium]
MIKQRTPIELDSRRAWGAAGACAAANGTAFGIAYTFGNFVDAMADEFDATRGPTAVIFGLTLLFFFGGGAVAGPLGDRFGALPMFVIGATVFVTGLAVTSTVEHLWLGYLTYGIGVGVGAGMFIAPLSAQVGRLFVQRRAVALATLAAGNGVGTLVMSPLSAELIERNGWRSAYLWLAVIAGVVFVAAVPLIGTRGRVPTPVPEDASVKLFASLEYRSLFFSSLLMSIGLYVAFAFVVPFAEDAGITSQAAARLIAVIGMTSIVGRLGLSTLTARFGPGSVFLAALALQPIAYVIWLLSDGNYWMLVAFGGVLGVAYGGFVAVGPELMIVTHGTAGLGKRMGVLYAAFGIGGLIGPPLAGWLSDNSSSTAPVIILTIAIVSSAVVVALPASRAA